MSTTRARIIAVLEALFVNAVVLAVVHFALAPLADWQKQKLGQYFLAYLAFIVIPVAWLLLTRRRLEDFGITARNFKADVRAALSAFVPFAIAGASLSFVPYTRWSGALIALLIQIGVLFWVAHLLNGKANPKSGLITIVLVSVMLGVLTIWKRLYPGLLQGTAGFVYYLFFLGLGEELLYRGYIQSRLDQAFGKPFAFGGARFGWGAVITSVLFGLLHVTNGLDVAAGTFDPQWAWGVWTVFGGLALSYVRERTGSIVAPTILHGLPQALAYFFVSAWS